MHFALISMFIVRSSNLRESFVKARNNEIPRTYIGRKKTWYFRLSNTLTDPILLSQLPRQENYFSWPCIAECAKRPLVSFLFDCVAEACAFVPRVTSYISGLCVASYISGLCVAPYISGLRVACTIATENKSTDTDQNQGCSRVFDVTCSSM